MQTPSVGRIVHYVNPVCELHQASMITEILSADVGSVCLTVFPSGTKQYHERRVLYDARMSPGTWHYPEVVNTVQYHESENEAEKREGPISNSPDIV